MTFSMVRWLFSVSTSKEEYFKEKMSSLAGLNKIYPVFRTNSDTGHFWLTRSGFKVDFLNVVANL